MTTEQKTTQEDQLDFDMATCMAMMEKMMSGHSESCDCEEIMSQINSEGDIPDDWFKVMSQMMEVHCSPQVVAERRSQES
jgi:hypothetical protein